MGRESAESDLLICLLNLVALWHVHVICAQFFVDRARSLHHIRNRAIRTRSTPIPNRMHTSYKTHLVFQLLSIVSVALCVGGVSSARYKGSRTISQPSHRSNSDTLGSDEFWGTFASVLCRRVSRRIDGTLF